jgi:hypothetical protein|tara:strand:+ start:3999 stop:4334 length:336 start_codon:yes stop_codon:yes gene_type:complete
MNPQKNKGDRAEREAATLLHDLTGYPVRRKLGAGRLDDTGDLDGIPETTIQVKDWANKISAIRTGIDGAAAQAVNAGTPFAATMIRLHGGRWVVAMSPEQFCTLLREAVSA